MTTITLTASEAREDLYNLIRRASMGLTSYEIKLRGEEPVILIAKDELEGWMETLDIMASPDEAGAIEEGRKEKGGISLEKLLGELEGKNNEYHSKKAGRKRTEKSSAVRAQ